MRVWDTVKAAGVKANYIQLQSIFWLSCKEAGVVKYHFHLQ